jgi:hypothetical protein
VITWRQLYIPTLLLICFSYPVTTVALLKLGAPVSTANQYIKAALVALSFVALIAAIPHSRKVKRVLIPMLAFFFIYGIRLIYDVLGEGILMGYQTPAYVFGYFFGLTFLPIIVMLLAYDDSDLPQLYLYTFFALVLVNIALLFHALTADAFASETAFSGRVEVAGDLEQTAVLNPLTFGIMGAMLSAFVIGFLTVSQHMKIRYHTISLILLAIGGANILFSASRGPAIAFMLVIAVTIFSLLRGLIGHRRMKVRTSTWLYIGVMFLALLYLVFASEMEIFLFDRFELTYEGRLGGAQEERDFLFANAWADFLSSPLFGSSYVVSVGAASPHNILLESLMSVGLLGSVFFLIAITYSFIALWRLLNGSFGERGYTLALSTLCIMTLGLTSYSIGQSPELWILLSLITILGNTPRSRET